MDTWEIWQWWLERLVIDLKMKHLTKVQCRRRHQYLRLAHQGHVRQLFREDDDTTPELLSRHPVLVSTYCKLQRKPDLHRAR